MKKQFLAAAAICTALAFTACTSHDNQGATDSSSITKDALGADSGNAAGVNGSKNDTTGYSAGSTPPGAKAPNKDSIQTKGDSAMKQERPTQH